MSFTENQKIQLFEEFYCWLKKDGIKPLKSERLHRKSIFASLMANNQMTIDNFNDFTQDRDKSKIRALIGQTINYQGQTSIVQDIKFLNNASYFKIITSNNSVFKFKNDFKVEDVFKALGIIVE